MLQNLKQEFVSNAAIQTLFPTAAVIFIFKNPDVNPHPYLLYGVCIAAIFGFRNSFWSILALMGASAWFRYKMIPDPVVSPIWAMQNSAFPVTFFMVSGVVGVIRDQLNSDVRLLTEENSKLKDIQDRVEFAYHETRKRNDQLEEQTAQEFRRTLEALAMYRADTFRELLKVVMRLLGLENIAVYKIQSGKILLLEHIGQISVELKSDLHEDFNSVVASLQGESARLLRLGDLVILRIPIIGKDEVRRGFIEIYNPPFLSVTHQNFRIFDEVAQCIEKRL